MTTQRLKINRDVLAKFLPDPRSIKEFEKVFSTIDQNSEDQTLMIDDVSKVASGASASALLAISLIEAVNQLAELAATKPSCNCNQSQDDDIQVTHSQVIESNVIHNHCETQQSFDYIDFNQASFVAEPNRFYVKDGVGYIGLNKLSYDNSITITNNSTVAFNIGDVIGLLGSVYQKYDSLDSDMILIGISDNSIPVSSIGVISTGGVISIDTTGFSVGTQLYASDTAIGEIASTGTYKVGIVTNNNQILVRI